MKVKIDDEIRLCLAIPIANEEGSIERFLDAVCIQLSNDDRVILIIDSVSVDSTRSIVENFIQERNLSETIFLIHAPENRCVRDAYFCGYQEAASLRPKWILEMDAGFSHDPKEIPRFIDEISKGYDYVGGSRFLSESHYRCGLYRRIFSQGGSFLARLLLGSKLSDMTSGYQCFTLRSMQMVLDKGLVSKGTFFQTEIRYRMSMLNWSEIPIEYGNTKNTVPFAYITDSLFSLLHLFLNRNKM